MRAFARACLNAKRRQTADALAKSELLQDTFTVLVDSRPVVAATQVVDFRALHIVMRVDGDDEVPIAVCC